ncbi:MAG TPA: MerR family transcriptional regulator [Holophaga sp.]|nr:MerR family transcriptional regulator [Holophaga sp.]
MLTISALARRFGLARSTLLHYDRLGLLKAQDRTGSGYRLYGPESAARLEAIRTYRRAGLSLEAIRRILAGSEGDVARALEARLVELDREMADLRAQQRLLADLLERPGLAEQAGPLDRAAWTDLLRASGMSDADMETWHRTFEGRDPVRHQRFLEALGFGAVEAERLRARFRAPEAPSHRRP